MPRIIIVSLAVLPLLAGAAGAQNSAPVAISSNPAFAAFGGEPGIARIVDDGVDRLLRDDRIKAHFAETNIPRLKKLLTEQFCVLLGGNCKYEGRTMQKAHSALGLRNADFNALAEDFQFAMDAANVPFFYQNVLLKQLAPMQHDIVTK
jgi:hemoglobin